MEGGHREPSPNPAAAEGIFSAALALPLSERPEYLASACGSDARLRQRVEALLRAHEAPEGFLPERPGSPQAAGSILSSAPPLPETEKPGDRIGRYKLLQKLGEGGCGVVYMAEQEEPVRRRVALKIIKLGMDTRQVVGRFEAERQALALMDHPNIAKVHDAGATETGRPYFVMELVGGIKITDYCEQNHLNTKQRLDLFIQVCRAIQHAHQKGIIHRDIKPSNVLVAKQDGVPVPKVIDFGIAKATQGRLTNDTVFTAFEQFLGTAAYVSPEQAQVGGLDVDTRSDIYSLGVLLYELLTGKTPFDTKELLAAGLDAMRRTIQEKEPPTPSTRLNQELATTKAESRERKTETETRELVKLVRGDLDWIVMKCLEKDRSRRYETANGLAMDLHRHLNNEPVVASPPSQLYRFHKMIRRNRAVAIASAAAIVLLVAGSLVTTWLAVRATRAESQAKQRLSESETLSKFLTAVFRSPDPARDGRTITMAEKLDSAARNLDRDLGTQPARRAQLQSDLALTYMALGLYPESIALQEKVRDYYLSVGGPEHPDSLGASQRLGEIYVEAGRPKEGVKLLEEVLALRRRLVGPEYPGTLSAAHSLARCYSRLGRLQEALKLREQVLTLRRKVLGPEHPDIVRTISSLALSCEDTGQRRQAMEFLEQALPLSRKVLGPEHPDTIGITANLANSYGRAGRAAEALALREQVLILDRKVFGPDHPDTLTAMNNLAASYADADRRDEAITLRGQVLEIARKTLGPKHPLTIAAMQTLALLYADAGRGDEALTLLEQALPLSRETLGPEHPHTLWAMTYLANSYANAGRLDDALKLREQVLQLRRKVNGPEHPDTLWAMLGLAVSYTEAGCHDQALKLREEVLPLSRKVLGADHPDTLWAMIGLADSYRKTGRPGEAVELGVTSLELFRQKLGFTHLHTFGAMTELAVSYCAAGRTGDAIALEQEELQLEKRHLPPGHAYTLRSMENLAGLYERANMQAEAQAVRQQLAELRSKGATNNAAGPARP